MQQAVMFNEYDKITDDLCMLSNGYILRFNVSLGSKAKDNKKIPFHNEYRYNSNKYINHNSLITVRRKFDYYMSIENYNKDIKDYIMIRAQDMIFLKNSLYIASRWFTDPKFNNLFALDNGKLIRMGQVDPVIIRGLCSSNYMILSPTVIEYENNSYEGVQFTLTSGNYFNITVDKFMELLYIIDTFNMHLSAQMMLAYLGKPPEGVNQTSFADDNAYISQLNTPDITPGFSGVNREIETPKRKKSFFDKMNEM